MDIGDYIVSNLENLPYGLYHLAGSESCSLYELMLETVRLLNLDIHIEPVNADSFQTQDIKNRHVLLKSQEISPLRSWRSSLAAYCYDWKGYLVGDFDVSTKGKLHE